MTTLTRELRLPAIGGRICASHDIDFEDPNLLTGRGKQFFWTVEFAFAGPDGRYNPAVGGVGARDATKLIDTLIAAVERIKVLEAEARALTADYNEPLARVGSVALSIGGRQTQFELVVGLSSGTNHLSRRLNTQQVSACIRGLNEAGPQADKLLCQLQELVCAHKEAFAAETIPEVLALAANAKDKFPGMVFSLGKASVRKR